MRWVAVAFLFASSLAGCSEPANVAGAHDDALVNEEDGNTTLPVAQNLPPIPQLDVDSLQGPIPFAVNFTLNGTDPNGDVLSWSLDIEGDGVAEYEGTGLPATANHTFTTAGTFNVTFVASDGLLNGTTVITINATAEAAPGYGPAQPPITFSGQIAGAAGQGPLGGQTHTFEVGVGQRLIHGTITYGTGCAGDIDWTLHDPGGAEVDAAESLSGTGEGAVDATDPVPGTWSVRTVAYAAACAAYTVTLTFE